MVECILFITRKCFELLVILLFFNLYLIDHSNFIIVMIESSLVRLIVPSYLGFSSALSVYGLLFHVHFVDLSEPRDGLFLD